MQEVPVGCLVLRISDASCADNCTSSDWSERKEFTQNSSRKHDHRKLIIYYRLFSKFACAIFSLLTCLRSGASAALLFCLEETLLWKSSYRIWVRDLKNALIHRKAVSGSYASAWRVSRGRDLVEKRDIVHGIEALTAKIATITFIRLPD